MLHGALHHRLSPVLWCSAELVLTLALLLTRTHAAPPLLQVSQLQGDLAAARATGTSAQQQAAADMQGLRQQLEQELAQARQARSLVEVRAGAAVCCCGGAADTRLQAACEAHCTVYASVCLAITCGC